MSAEKPLHPLAALLQKRIAIIDGAMGTMVQRYKLRKRIIAASGFATGRGRISRGTTSCCS
ncbi:MAG: hypothetical protein WDN28_33875 [Chthoniobacter sp.]